MNSTLVSLTVILAMGVVARGLAELAKWLAYKIGRLNQRKQCESIGLVCC